MTDRILSPDGSQFWDGSSWVPVADDAHIASQAQAAVPVPPAAARPPAMNEPAVDPASERLRAFAASQAAQRPVERPDSTIAPVIPQSESAQVDNSWAATKWAWRIALSPLVYLVGTYVAGVSDTGAYILVGLIVIAATFACSADVKELNQRGVKAEQSFTAAVLLFYIIGAPAYLIYRTRKASSTPLIPVAWFASVGAVIAGFVLAGGGLGLQMDVPVLEADLAGEVRELGARGVSVDCPDDEAYADGDMVICDVTTTSDGPLQIVLDMRNDLGYEWQVQQP